MLPILLLLYDDDRYGETDRYLSLLYDDGDEDTFYDTL